jgi:hypothetical protein
MINAIKNEPKLGPFIKQKSECCYDGQPEYPYIDDNINDDSVVALTPDAYYNSLGLDDTPPSVDHLVTLACHEKGFAHFLIEDKNVRKTRGIRAIDIYHKFKTTLEDFMTGRFGQIFLDPVYSIRFVELYLVTNPQLRKPREKGSITGDGTQLEQLLSVPPLKFRGLLTSIKHSYPEVLVTQLSQRIKCHKTLPVT